MNLPKWMNIYNSLIRMKFYAFLETSKPEVIVELDNHFQGFVDTQGLNPSNKDKVRFFGGDMLIGLSYLILVRTTEYIKNELDDIERIEVLKISNWNLYNISTFNDLISKYSINVTKLADKKHNGDLYYTNDSEKLEYYIRKLRNSLGHYHYINPDMKSIKLTDINPRNQQIEMECEFKYSDFLNFCMDYGYIVNASLYKLYHP